MANAGRVLNLTSVFYDFFSIIWLQNQTQLRQIGVISEKLILGVV